MGRVIRITEERLSKIIKDVLNEAVDEYRERKSYQNPNDAGFIERMNQFCEKYGYEPFRYGRSQGLDPEAYAKQIIRRHNTFLRGVNMDPDNEACREWIEHAKQELAKRGSRNPSMEDIAKFAATVPGFGRKGHYVAATGNADIYGTGGGSPQNGGFGGVAKVIRPYSLGPDRMRWFDVGEGDFIVRDNSEYKVGDGENDQTAIVSQVKPGDVVDAWGDHSQGATENIIGGETEFGGWVTPAEQERSRFSSKRVKRSHDRALELDKRAVHKNRTGQKLSRKEQDILERPYAYFNTNEDPDYNDFLTSRNTYYRGK